jgi:hypothetical protein
MIGVVDMPPETLISPVVPDPVTSIEEGPKPPPSEGFEMPMSKLVVALDEMLAVEGRPPMIVDSGLKASEQEIVAMASPLPASE